MGVWRGKQMVALVAWLKRVSPTCWEPEWGPNGREWNKDVHQVWGVGGA